jgi:hypothetical protein
LAKGGHEEWFMKKCYYWWKRTIEKMVLHLTWGSWYWMPDVFDRFFADFGEDN